MTAKATHQPSGSPELADLLFRPKSVAFIGASGNPSKLISFRPIDYLKRFGFDGSVYPVNPGRTQVQGLQAYPSVLATPTQPELVVIALPRTQVLGALEESAEAGARVAVVYSSGFSEVADGAELHDQLRSFAARSGVRVVGPNCQGVANVASGFLPSFSTTFAGSQPKPGRAAIISQSGAMAGMIYNEWRRVGGGVNYWASTGNEADVTVGELSRSVIEYDDVDVMMLYLESVRREDELASLAERAGELGKHVIAFRSARTAQGWQAARRHTGAGAVDGDRSDARIPSNPHLKHAGSIDELISLAQIARSGKTPENRSIGIISNSGGLGVATTDAATRRDLTVDALSEETRSTLETVLPGFASTENPVDVTAQLLNDPALLGTALPAMLDDAEVGASIVSLGAVGDGYDIDRIIDDVVDAHRTTSKPIVVVWMGSNVDVREPLGASGVPTYLRVEDAVAAIDAFAPAPPPVSTKAGPDSPWFDDLFVGATYSGGPLRLTAADLEAYAVAARQSDDGVNVHSSPRAAQAAGLSGRLVSGLHTLTAITILGESLGLWRHCSLVAGFQDVRFEGAVIEGDSLNLELTVARLKPLSGARGLVSFDFVLRTHAPVATGMVNYVFDEQDTGR